MKLESLTPKELNDLYLNVIQALSLARNKRPPIENLVLEGGGVKGGAYLEVAKVLKENGLLDKVKRVAGSSAGGIMAYFLALNMDLDEMEDLLLHKMDPASIMDKVVEHDFTRVIKAKGMEIGITDLVALFKNKGIYKGEVFQQLIQEITKELLHGKVKALIIKRDEELIAQHRQALADAHLAPDDVNKGVDEFIEKLIEGFKEEHFIRDFGKVTFGQMRELGEAFPEFGFKELYLTGTNLTNGGLKVFSADTDPEMPIWLALRITMSFPGGFVPVKYKGHYYADGGIADNYPMSIFDAYKFLSHGRNAQGVNPCTLGFLVDSQEEIEQRWGMHKAQEDELKFGKFLGGVISGIHQRGELLHKLYDINSVQILVPVDTMEILTPEKQQLVLKAGRDQTLEYVDHYLAETQYDHMVDYKTLEQKYYSLHPTELKRILEEELWPALQDLYAIGEIFADLNLEDEQKKVKEAIAQLDQSSVKNAREQVALLEAKDASIFELQSEITHCRSRYEELERQEREIWRQIDAGVLSRDEVIARRFAVQTQLLDEKAKLKDLEASFSQQQKARSDLMEQIDAPILSWFNREKLLEHIDDLDLPKLSSQQEDLLNQHLDCMLNALRGHEADYPDPRFTSIFEKEVELDLKQREAQLLKRYEDTYGMPKEQALAKAKEHLGYYEGFMRFGMSDSDATEQAVKFYQLVSIYESKVSEPQNAYAGKTPTELALSHILKGAILQELAALGFDEDNLRDRHDALEQERQSYVKELMSQYAKKDLSPSERMVQLFDVHILAKQRLFSRLMQERQEVTKQKASAKEKATRNIVSSTLDFEYTKGLHDMVAKLEGGWGDSIQGCSRSDIVHNLRNMKVDRKGQTTGKWATEFRVNTLAFDIKEDKIVMGALKREVKYPSIKAHFLIPASSNMVEQ